MRWFRAGHRDLPWRRTREPYRVWVSEIMLQQTRVEVVVPYYERFVARFPTPHALADAPLDDVLAAWSGLGYYRRARQLHAAAALVVREHAGDLPADDEALRALPGIGRYTAGAIRSIAFGHAAPIVDGNVARVLSRLFALAGGPGDAAWEKRLWTLAAALVPAADPSAFNQGLMELGATVCTPRAPRCDACPLARFCKAHAAGREEAFPPAKQTREAGARRALGAARRAPARRRDLDAPPRRRRAQRRAVGSAARRSGCGRRAGRDARAGPAATLDPRHGLPRARVPLRDGPGPAERGAGPLARARRRRPGDDDHAQGAGPAGARSRLTGAGPTCYPCRALLQGPPQGPTIALLPGRPCVMFPRLRFAALCGAVLLALGPGEALAATVFDAPSSPIFTPDRAWFVESCDWDGDGRDDIVASHRQGLAWFRSLATGGFASPAPLWLTEVRRFTVVDLDLDGRLDLVGVRGQIPDGEDAGLVLVHGAGAGAAEPGVVVPIPGTDFRSGLLTRDLDGDLRPELVTSLPDSSRCVVLRSTGPRAWAAPTSVPTLEAGTPGGLLDWNLDGWLDLAVRSESVDSLALHPGGPAATFSPPSLVPVALLLDIAAGDLDAILGEDLLIAGPSGSAVLSNQGDGSFAAAIPADSLRAYSLELADLDADGEPDAYGSDGSSILVARSNGDGTFGDPLFFRAYAAPPDVTAGDVDDDGRADLAAVGFSSRAIAVLRGNGDATFGTPYVDTPGYAWDLAVGDVTGDGIPDAVVAERDSGAIDLHAGVGDGTFASPVRIAGVPGARAVKLGDVDGDTDLDIVAGGGGVLSTILALPGASFASPVTVAGPALGNDLALADLDADGSLDAVLASASAAEAWVYAGGPGGFALAQTLALPAAARRIALGIVDAGATPDLVCTSGNAFAFFPGTGAGTFSGPGIVVATPAAAQDVAIDDLDGDGARDVAVVYLDALVSGLARFESDGGTGFAPSGAWTTALDPLARAATSELLVADFDGDTDRDAFALAADRYSALLLNGGDGSFAASQGFGHFRPGVGAATADLDGDGGPDVVVAGVSSGFDPISGLTTRTSALAVLLNRVAALADVPPPAATPARALQLALAPNPATLGSRVTFVAPRAADASIEVYAVTGRQVASRALGLVAAGRRSEAIPGRAQLAPGLYWARVKVDETVDAIRFVVTR